MACGIAFASRLEAQSPEAIAYLNRAIDLMEKNSLHKKDIDWPTLRRDALARAGGSRSAIDTYAAIREALTSLKDHHSFLQPPSPPSSQPSSFRPFELEPESSLERTDLAIAARVTIPTFLGAGDDAERFAAKLQSLLRELSSAHPSGWIVDLRGNAGGNMWPMLLGNWPSSGLQAGGRHG
jgi:carboxyl-terminal processing protease